MINKPAFNFLHITDVENAPRMNTQMQLMYIEDIHPKERMMMFSQMCDYGHRMCRENEDYKYWNNCIFEDIDYKVYIEHHKDFIDPKTLYDQVYEYLFNNYKDIFYYSEMSRSFKGFHFIFYFNVERNKNNRIMCKALVNFIIHKAFNELGYKDIIDFPKVYDTCTDSFYQAIFFTKNYFYINNECNGKNSEKYITDNYMSIKEIYDKLTVKIIKKKKERKEGESEYNKDDWDISFFEEDIKYKGPYLDHHERWNLFKSLSGLCDKDILEEEWDKCAVQLPSGNGHDKYFYMSEPRRNKWYNLVDGNEYIDKDLLAQFGYNIKFIKKLKDENTVKQSVKKISKERIYI